MIRLLWTMLLGIPGTMYWGTRIVWNLWRRPDQAQCICDDMPRRWAALMLRLAGVKVELQNEEVLEADRPLILVGNHVSWIDPLALAAFSPRRFVFVAKQELGRVPFFGWALRSCGHILLDRKNRQQAIESLARARRKLERDKPTVIMFPEGTRSATGELQPFKKGAFVLAIQTRADIVPVAVFGSRDVMKKHSLLIRPGTVTIRYGDPISVEPYALQQRDQLKQDTWDALAGMLKAGVEPAING